jgi:hypothetical protein
MYLIEGAEYRPYLDLRLDEPELLRAWFLNLPIRSMNTMWKLNPELGRIWYDHFSERIMHPNYTGVRLDSQGRPCGGAVLGSSLSATHRKWTEWIESTEDRTLFGRVRLREMTLAGNGNLGSLMLAPDTYCLRCDELEPTWLYQGTNEGYHQTHEHYKKMIKDVLDNGMFGFHPKINSCPSCDSTRYATLSFLNYARRRPGMCECMPCRGDL